MSTNRAISSASPVSGVTFTKDVADQVNKISGYLAGVAVTPSGTNTYTFSIEITTGFTGPADGMGVTVKVPNTNTGAVQFNVASTGNKTVTKANGDAFTGGELVSGTIYTFVFLESDDEWRLVGSGGSASANYPFLYIDVFDTAGADTWIAPWDCDALFICVGAGGSGARAEGASATASGGAAGGYSEKFVANISSGDEAAVTVGAGGASVGGASGSADGNDGGSSSVSSTDFSLSLSCSGGEGGNAAGGAAAIGGSATGGDVNNKGGDSGACSGASGSGGGAVGIFGEGNASEDATNTATVGATAVASTYPAVKPWLNLSGVGGGQQGGAFCGGGGAYSIGGGADTVGGNGGIGGGGGGANTDTGTGSSATSGNGGDGCVIVIYTADKSA